MCPDSLPTGDCSPPACTPCSQPDQGSESIKPQITHLDPWLKQSGDQAAMDTAIFVGQYDLPIEGVFTITESIFLSGGPLNWFLWATHSEVKTTRGLAAVGVFQGSPQEAAIFLFTALQRYHFPYTGATEPFHGGLLSAETLQEVVANLHGEWDRNRLEAIDKAEQNPPVILLTARELQLDPHPTGHSGNDWLANCPSGRGHSIMISASSNSFGCGYCRRKGGPEELRQFHQSFH